MKHIFIASLAAAACTTAGASPFGPDHGFDAVHAAVESAPEAPPHGHPSWLADVFEHEINPEAAVRHEARPTTSDQKSPEASHQPLDRKE